jgi:hypothetical protein
MVHRETSSEVDVRRESSKLPLDVAVVESILAIVSGSPTLVHREERETRLREYPVRQARRHLQLWASQRLLLL